MIDDGGYRDWLATDWFAKYRAFLGVLLERLICESFPVSMQVLQAV